MNSLTTAAGWRELSQSQLYWSAEFSPSIKMDRFHQKRKKRWIKPFNNDNKMLKLNVCAGCRGRGFPSPCMCVCVCVSSVLTCPLTSSLFPCQVCFSNDGRLPVLHPAHHLWRCDHGHGTDQGVNSQRTVPHHIYTLSVFIYKTLGSVLILQVHEGRVQIPLAEVCFCRARLYRPGSHHTSG